MLAVLSSLLAGVSGTLARAESLTLPVGTKFHMVLETNLSTKVNKVGDPFRGRLVIPVFANEREALPVGTVVEGKLASLQAPGRVRGAAEMQLRPEKFTLPDGRDFTLAATLTDAQTGDELKVDSDEGTVSRTGKEGMDVKGTAGGAAMGGVMGGMVGGGKGALIGAGAMATVAVLRQIFKRGNDANLPAGSEIVLELNRDVSIPLMEEVPPSDRPALRRGDAEKPAEPVVVCQSCTAQ
jgi:hypothetical protein